MFSVVLISPYPHQSLPRASSVMSDLEDVLGEKDDRIRELLEELERRDREIQRIKEEKGDEGENWENVENHNGTNGYSEEE